LVSISANLILLQPTSPLRNHQQIFQAISDFQKLKTLSLISVTESTESPFWTFTVQNGFLAPLIETKHRDDLYQYFLTRGQTTFQKSPETLPSTIQ
jgi:N-acylneuraminate cytidylyltransferase